MWDVCDVGAEVRYAKLEGNMQRTHDGRRPTNSGQTLVETKASWDRWTFDCVEREDDGRENEALTHWAVRIGGVVQQQLVLSATFAAQGLPRADALIRATQLAIDVLNYEMIQTGNIPEKPHITEKEREVLLLVNQRLSSAQIAGRLCITKYTVDKHIQRV